ncbi:AGE family epimerase/isomerase [Lederbergia wuyishanensis]|uniref:Cellobiose 2-epimerase n=1 Tax=Lederbergia wuyishanensis TaxID=1347903 RepID=A0ABU0D8Y9_9BACI|nr:AGE family epimerase/isomerase [Lederbergia wuyishanensis]MCJ8007549.1 AGE family epimerase/isomerase [Lederbergia wuyishanensis]MDQ0344870.1 mannobiose 2-epimerase [Lederbergia wuyishanensis]
MIKLKEEVTRELTEHILPFWLKLQDKEYGGLYGLVDYDLTVNEEADKSGIVTARFLWTFSAAYRATGNPEYLEAAKKLFRFLKEKVFDQEFSGLYWLLDYKGDPKDTRKHVYTQTFGVYSCSEYFMASKDEEALELAKTIYFLIEEKGFNREINAYCEEFDREWNDMPNQMLSGNGILADITMNTHIHVLEAYTNLYKAWPAPELQERIENLLHILHDNIYIQETKFLGVFFDKNWNNLIDVKSFGHDIEASWLIDEAIQTIAIENPAYNQMVIDIAYNIADCAIEEDGSLVNEQVGNEIDRTRVWWVQAEAAVGFYNAYERTGDERFLKLTKGLWDYMKSYLIDKRENGEWYSAVNPDGQPQKINIADSWKASYHNGRFCLEFMKRTRTIERFSG